MSLFTIKGLSFQYDQDKKVLTNVSFNINKGEIVGIIGPNGSGKTTLLHMLSGIYRGDNGTVTFNKKPLFQYKKKELARQIAFMEQETTPPLSFTVEEVVSMGRYPWIKPFSTFKNGDYLIVNEVLHQLDLAEKRNTPLYALSGGQRQLVALARAMVQQPQVLILDEPTTFLDIGHQLLVMNHIKAWQMDHHLTIIMVLHDLNIAAQYADKLLLMNDGKVKAWGKVSEVLEEHTIESVYKAKTVIVKHPVTGVSQILLN